MRIIFTEEKELSPVLEANLILIVERLEELMIPVNLPSLHSELLKPLVLDLSENGTHLVEAAFLPVPPFLLLFLHTLKSQDTVI